MTPYQMIRKAKAEGVNIFLCGDKLKAEGSPEAVTRWSKYISSNRKELIEELIKEWQGNFCDACGHFNGWRGRCPVDLDDCLLTKVIEASTLDNLRGLEIGKGIKTDAVIDAWCNSGEAAEDLFNQPIWLLAMAEHLQKEE